MDYLNYLLEKYQTSLNNGLTSFSSKEKLFKEGENVLKEKKKRSPILVFLKQFNDPTIYLLFIAIILSIFLKEFIDALIIVLVLLVNSIVGAIQEIKAEKSLEALKKLSSFSTNVIRDGKKIRIPSSNIVLGDIVCLEEGDIVPCDVFLFEINELLIDEALLTGESDFVYKKINNDNLEKETPSLRVNEAFMSTKVIKGNGKGVCIRKGMDTEVGKIATLIKEETSLTPLQERLIGLSKFLGIFTIIIVLLIVGYSFINKKNLIESIVFAISLAVAAIPEGLPAVVTIVLSLGVMKLAKVNAIVKSLPSVETLGLVDVVCVDKTGTITKNELNVERIYFNNKYQHNIKNTILEELFVFNNNASLEAGDPLEIALNRYVTNYLEIKNKGSRIKEIPFNSVDKIMGVDYKLNNKIYHSRKGAYEEIIKRCRYIFINNKEEILNEERIKELNNIVEEMTSLALKVIAFSYSINNSEGQVFTGIVGLFDSPRANIKESVEKIKNASIKPIMITGDHINTAYSVAKQVGVCQNKNQCLDLSKEKELSLDDPKIESYSVFARVSPTHKVQIVDYYKKRNHVVAMTGDGVNDSPALKRADVGIAMGIKGSDVTKSSSDIILQDDNFQTIEKAIEEGRNIFLNIKKSILFLLSSNLGEVLVIMFFVFLNLPSPLISIHILWVNLISDSLPALALGSEGKYDDVMNDKPRKKDESIFARNGLFITIFYGFVIALVTSIGFLYPIIKELNILQMPLTFENIRNVLSNETVLIKARSMAFCALTMSELFHMIGMSNIKANVFKILKNNNYMRTLAFFIGIILQFIVIEIPFMNTIFNTIGLTSIEWGIVLLLAIAPLIIHEILLRFYRQNL